MNPIDALDWYFLSWWGFSISIALLLGWWIMSYPKQSETDSDLGVKPEKESPLPRLIQCQVCGTLLRADDFDGQNVNDQIVCQYCLRRMREKNETAK